MWQKSCLAAATLSGLAAVAGAADGCFLRENERWMLSGDSITSTDTYRQILRRVIDHYFPGNQVVIQNEGVWGRLAEEDFPGGDRKRTLVSIMLGMNNIIHHEWGPEPDVEKIRENYRKSILAQIRSAKADGATVILMTPTLTDEFESSFFSAVNTREALKKLGDDIRQLAAEEDCLLLPVAEELEAYQRSLGPNQVFRPDGVHPYGWGQYVIARAFLNRMNLNGKLNGERKWSEIPAPVPVRVEPVRAFLNGAEEPLELRLRAEKPLRVRLRWSFGKERGAEELTLGTEPRIWRFPVAPETLRIPLGGFAAATVDLTTEAGESSLYLIDLARTRVLKPVNGVVEGEVVTDRPRSEGPTVARWRLEETPEGELWFTGTVRADEYPRGQGGIFRNVFGLNGLQMVFDFRPAERFANLNFDRDVHMVILSVCDQPHFSAQALAWMGRRIQNALFANAEPLADGYRWTLGFRGQITDYRPFDLRPLDYYGFSLLVADSEQNRIERYPLLEPVPYAHPESKLQQPIIVDRKNRFPGTETTTVQLFGF